MKTCFKFSLFLWIGLLFSTGIQAEVRPFVKGTFSSILKASQGKQIAVIFWSVTCSPCLQEMFLWKKLMEEDPKTNLVFVSTDEISTADKIETILGKFGLEDSESWAFADPFVERLRYDVDKRWYGEMPMTFFLSKNGDMKKVIGMVDDETLDNWKSANL